MSRTKRKDFYAEVGFKNLDKPYKDSADKKARHKPGSIFKKITKDKRKAKEKQVMKNLKYLSDIEDVNLPRFPKTDEWEWN